MTDNTRNNLAVRFQSRSPYWEAEAGQYTGELNGNQFAAVSEAISQLCDQYSSTWQMLHNGVFEAHRSFLVLIDLAAEPSLKFLAELDSIADGELKRHLKVWEMAPVEVLRVEDAPTSGLPAPEDGEPLYVEAVDTEPVQIGECDRCGAEIGSYDNGAEWFHTVKPMDHRAVPSEVEED